MYVFACIGYREVMDGAVLSITGLTFLTSSFPDHHSKPGHRPGNETNLLHIRFCLPVVLAHGAAGRKTCMDVLVTSADVKPRP